jgi:hypothetical protein
MRNLNQNEIKAISEIITNCTKVSTLSGVDELEYMWKVNVQDMLVLGTSHLALEETSICLERYSQHLISADDFIAELTNKLNDTLALQKATYLLSYFTTLLVVGMSHDDYAIWLTGKLFGEPTVNVESNDYFRFAALLKELTAVERWDTLEQAEHLFEANVIIALTYNSNLYALELLETYKMLIVPCVEAYERKDVTADTLLSSISTVLNFMKFRASTDIEVTVNNSLLLMASFFTGGIKGISKDDYNKWLINNIDKMNTLLTSPVDK